jgi:HEPN domain-containing protein
MTENIDSRISEIGNYIDFLFSCIGTEASNITATTEISKTEFKDKVGKSNFVSFINFANYHYFISRVLFLSRDQGYSFFAGQQCVENYFKGFIRMKGEKPRSTHKLIKLLEDCRTYADQSDEFIFSDQVFTIAYKYNYFYEIPRYPVTNQKWLPYMSQFPDDIFVLDYFVHKMLLLMSLENERQSLRNLHIINMLNPSDHTSEIHKLFFFRNITTEYMAEELPNC